MAQITLTVEEVAHLLKLSTITVYRELVKKRLPGFKVGNQWRVRQDILEEWMEEKSGWKKQIKRVWEEFQKVGKRKRISEASVREAVLSTRRGHH